MTVGLFEIKNMKKNIFTKTLSVFAVATVLTGCIEETYPQGSTQREDQVLNSDLALAAMVNGISGAMMNGGTAGYFANYRAQSDFGIPAIHIATESMLEDLAIMGDNPAYYQFYPYAYNLGMGNNEWPASYFWDCYYAWIKLANSVITLIDENTTNELYKNYLGQAYTYRAAFYLDLARLYEPKENELTDVSSVLGLTVPIVDENTTEEMSRNNPRVTREKMYEFIFSDLQKAEKYFEGAKFSYVAPSLAAVYGLYARAYLEMGYWTEGGDQQAFKNAYDYADKAITASGCTPLTQSQWEDPATGFNSGSSNNAWIWGITVSSEQLGNMLSFTAHLSGECMWGYGQNYSRPGAATSFYNKIRKGDFRRHSWYQPEEAKTYSYKLAGNAATQAEFKKAANAAPGIGIKFRPVLGEVQNYTVGSPADHPMIRVEEMEFIKMEAKAQTDWSAAADLLNNFMKNRITDGSYDCKAKLEDDKLYVPVTDTKTFIDEMFFQKRVEFWGEGILFFDYKRLDKGITRYYKGSNHPAVWQFNTNGRSPQWNIVINQVGEMSSNSGITDATNNPDPSGKLEVPSN